ncbi:cytochrome c [Magnetospira thiophila]
MRTKWPFAVFALVVVGVVGVYANAILSGPPMRPGDPEDLAQVARGKTLYAETCATCHGANLEGETPDWRRRKEDGTLPAPPHDTSGHTWHHDDPLLFSYIKQGGQALMPAGVVSGMPPFGEKLSDVDIWAVLAFIKSHWTLEARQRQEDITRHAASRG